MRIARGERHRQELLADAAHTAGWSAVVAYFRAVNRKQTETLAEFLEATTGRDHGAEQAGRTEPTPDALLERVRAINAAFGGEDLTRHG